MRMRGLLLLIMVWLGMMTVAGATTIKFREASATITVSGVTSKSVVALPYNWDREHRGLQGTATFEMPFALAAPPHVRYDVYFVRLGTTYEVWLNDVLLEQKGALAAFDGDDYGQIPRLIVIPPGVLQQDNLLRIHIKADKSRRAGVPRVMLGPEAEIEPLYLDEYRWYVVGTLVVVILSLVVGTIALALWWSQIDPTQPKGAKRDSLYLFAALAEFIWALRIGSVLVERPPLPWPWWGTIVVLTMGAWTSCMIVFCFNVAGWTKRPWTPYVYRMLGVLMVAGIPAALWGWHNPLALTVWYGTINVVVVPFAIAFCWAATRKASRIHMIVAAAAMLNVLVGIRDWVVLRASDSFGAITMTRYSSVVFGLSLGYIVITRFREVSARARDLSANMAVRVAQKEQELEQTYQRLEQFAREQERTAERTRILRDMHDGVGSHISTAIRQLQSGQVNTEALVQTLRDSLDQLKLSIDAMNLPPGDITALLANLRYRLEPRFKASDIELQWAVDLLPPLPRLDHKAMRHLQFMVFEALSNVLQHAHASVLRIELRATPRGGAQLRVIDNGHGFEPDRVKRGGLGSLRERAAAIGADLVIHSAPGSTAVEIVLDGHGAA